MTYVTATVTIPVRELPLRYAQRGSGRKLHLVTDFGNNRVARRALCGATPDSRGYWAMTINVPLAHACRNCCRIHDATR
jgi:hypothetical protein